MQLSASCLSAVDVRGTAFLINSGQTVERSKPVILKDHRASDSSSSIQPCALDRCMADTHLDQQEVTGGLLEVFCIPTCSSSYPTNSLFAYFTRFVLQC